MDSDGRPYHHGHLREALVEAGMGLAREGGISALGLREITRTVRVSPNAAYRHFADLHALVLAIDHEAQRRLVRDMIKTMESSSTGDDPAERSAERLRAFGQAYIQFAIFERGWFELTGLVQEDAPEGGTVEGDETMPTPHQILLDTLDEMVGSGALSTAGRNGAEWTCWSTIHGFAELATHGALQGIGRPVKESLAAQVVDTLVDGLAPSHGGDR